MAASAVRYASGAIPTSCASRSALSCRAIRCSANDRGSTPINTVGGHHNTSARANNCGSVGTKEPYSHASITSGRTGAPHAVMDWAT